MRSESRIHTPASLFIHLRALLREKKLLFIPKHGDSIQPSQIIEFGGTLHRNPLLETMESFVEMIELMKAFADKPSKGSGKQIDEMQKVKKQMESFVTSLKASEMADLTTSVLPTGHRGVVTLEKQFLNDQTMSDLVDGTFKVIGKVVRVIESTDESISLNRKTAVGRLPEPMLAQMKTAFESEQLAQMSLPPLEWQVSGPVVQVIPIAIFA